MSTVPDLIGALEAGLRRHNAKDEWGTDSVHMSDLAVNLPEKDRKCPRQIWHRLRGDARSDDSVGQLMMFDNGHSIHERTTAFIREPLLDQGWEITGVEVPVDQFLPDWMKGTLDLRLKGPNGEKVIADYKTKKADAFKYMNRPSASNVAQLRGYMMVEDADYGILLYIDREGSNTPVMFIVERNDAEVLEGMAELEQIKDSPAAPRRMLPKIRMGRNKGPDGVKLVLPWQCNYCPFLDVSCPGAVKPEYRDQIVGYNCATEGLMMKETYEHLEAAVAALMDD